jgi:hypothetical protein
VWTRNEPAGRQQTVKFKLALFTAFSLLCTALSAQYLESNIWLPDSLGGMSYPRAIAWNPMNNQICDAVASSSRQEVA